MTYAHHKSSHKSKLARLIDEQIVNDIWVQISVLNTSHFKSKVSHTFNKYKYLNYFFIYQGHVWGYQLINIYLDIVIGISRLITHISNP